MKGQDQLSGRQTSTNLRRLSEGRHVERRSFAARGNLRDELAAAIREPLIFPPRCRVAGDLLPRPAFLCRGILLTGHCQQAGGERRPHLGDGIEYGGEFGMAGQHGRPSCRVGPRQPLGVGAE